MALIQLGDHQKKALTEMKNGCILGGKEVVIWKRFGKMLTDFRDIK